MGREGKRINWSQRINCISAKCFTNIHKINHIYHRPKNILILKLVASQNLPKTILLLNQEDSWAGHSEKPWEIKSQGSCSGSLELMEQDKFNPGTGLGGMVTLAGVCGPRPVSEIANSQREHNWNPTAGSHSEALTHQVWATSLSLPRKQAGLNALMGLHSVCFCALISGMQEYPAHTKMSPGRC